MNRPLLAGLAVAFGLAAVAPVAATAAPRTSYPVGFEPTATRAFPVSHTARDMGRIPDAMPLHLVIGLPMRNRALIDQLLRRQNTPGDSMYQRYLEPAETNALFNPSDAQRDRVGAFLARNGFRNLRPSADNLLIEADATAAVVQRTFATEIHGFADRGQARYANVSPALIPHEMHGLINAVQGLNNEPAHASMHFASHRPAPMHPKGPLAIATPTPCLQPVNGLCPVNSYNADGFQVAYDAPSTSSGSGTPIAIFAEGNVSQVLIDLRTYESLNGLPQVPVRVIYTGIKSPDVAGLDEFDLDTQSSTAIAGNVKKLYIYVTTSLTDADTSVEFDRFKTDKLARAGSASFGICEVFPATDGTLTDDDEIFAEAAVQGQTVFSSAGDNGTTCTVGASTGAPGTGLPAQNYPGSSPYVVSVGGTTLVTNAADGTYSSEVSWMGTGGGISVEEGSPFWQQGVVPPVNNPPPPVPGASTNKAVPDIALDADPNTGAEIIVNGKPTGVGGTSLSSPLSLGVWSRLETLYKNKLGFASPLYYKMYKNFTTFNSQTGLYTPPVPPPGALDQAIGGYHDVIVGSNGVVAAPGYDFTTGLGTFDINVTLQDFPTSY